MSDRLYQAVVRYPQTEPGRGIWYDTYKLGNPGTLAQAKRAGFLGVDSDDFNIAVVEGGRLIDWTWMGKSINEDAAVLDDIAAELGMKR